MKRLYKTYWWVVLAGMVGLMMVFAGAAAGADERPADDPGGPAASAGYMLDEMVVSASKVEEAIDTIPRHVSVITGADIREAAGKNIIDLLGRESGISIRSSTGTDKHAVVDLRGMGDTAGSNVIVMVDGLPLNAPDMSGPSLAAVPLEQIERIEIVRGAGSVIYGSGAVGGVINIITRKPGEVPFGEVYASYGSFDTIAARAAVEGASGGLGIRLSAGLFDTDGYRDNGFLKRGDLNLASRYELNEYVSFLVSGSWYEDEYGLPGPVSREDADSRSRRVKTRWPDDSGETTELRGIAGVEADLRHLGIVTLRRGYDKRENAYVMGHTAAVPRGAQETVIDEDTRRLNLDYVKDYYLGGRYHMLQLGLDHALTEYVRENVYNGLRENSETLSLGVYVNNQLAITDRLLLNAGTRYNTYRGRFRTDERKLFENMERMWVNGESTRREWNNNAWALGVSYAVGDQTSVFASFNTSFRIPNVDEFAVSEERLRPQEGRHIEVGGRYRFGAFATLSIALFDIRIDDEIYYSEVNRNYEETTIRRGVETGIRVFPADGLNLWGNYTYTDAVFEVGNTTVPLVPAHMVNAGLQWFPAANLQVSFSGTYTGSRYDGNDLDNRGYEKLDAYAVFDAKATYERGRLTVFGGVDNILDNLYVTSGYSEQYYPMPGRNIFGGIRWKFI